MADTPKLDAYRDALALQAELLSFQAKWTAATNKEKRESLIVPVITYAGGSQEGISGALSNFLKASVAGRIDNILADAANRMSANISNLANEAKAEYSRLFGEPMP